MHLPLAICSAPQILLRFRSHDRSVKSYDKGQLPMPKEKRTSRTAKLLAASQGQKKKAQAKSRSKPAPQPTQLTPAPAKQVRGRVNMRPTSFPVPVSQPCGSATTYFGARKIIVPLSNASDRLLFITSTGDTAAVCGMITRNTTTQALTFNMYGLNKISQSGTDTLNGPTAGRSQTCEFELTNYSNPLTAGGELLIIPLSQRLGVASQPSSWTNANFNAVIASLIDYKYFKPHNLIDFMHVKKPRQFYCSVSDRMTYERFEPWRDMEPDTPAGFNTFATEFMVWPGLNPAGAAAQRARGMNYYAIWIPAVANPQSLNITVRAAYYLRWPLTTPMSEMQVRIPVSRGTLPETPRVSARYLISTGGIM